MHRLVALTGIVAAALVASAEARSSTPYLNALVTNFTGNLFLGRVSTSDGKVTTSLDLTAWLATNQANFPYGLGELFPYDEQSFWTLANSPQGARGFIINGKTGSVTAEAMPIPFSSEPSVSPLGVFMKSGAPTVVVSGEFASITSNPSDLPPANAPYYSRGFNRPTPAPPTSEETYWEKGNNDAAKNVKRGGDRDYGGSPGGPPGGPAPPSVGVPKEGLFTFEVQTTTATPITQISTAPLYSASFNSQTGMMLASYEYFNGTEYVFTILLVDANTGKNLTLTPKSPSAASAFGNFVFDPVNPKLAYCTVSHVTSDNQYSVQVVSIDLSGSGKNPFKKLGKPFVLQGEAFFTSTYVDGGNAVFVTSDLIYSVAISSGKARMLSIQDYTINSAIYWST